ncbi:MAG: lysophospholipid acyltransferase family protein [Christensenellales bacterium]
MEEIKKSQDRVNVLNKIEEYEQNGWFDRDVEDDPPSRTLQPDEVDYLNKKLKSKIATKYAYSMGKKFLDKIIKEKKLIIKETIGIENLQNLKSGAVITCNHFNAFDSFAVQTIFQNSKQKHKKFYRVIREGNYTNFPGFYGLLMRHCNTLPLSSNRKTMECFLKAVDTILQNGDFVLVYPEQSMWWNYKKPRPLKPGAFRFAVKNNVPVVPCFITMQDSDIMGEDGFYVQEYTIHISKPLYPNTKLGKQEQIQDLMEQNFNIWQDIYEKTYGIKLEYNTKIKKSATL